ncbi:hypothetical protein P886_0991 [Alteromonadaceae bacterium 2753L.S.0a.02]|nr:hypothetical protein P886_0991 [Alteromonadaceae bacterium 2753L.S.0a.02]
MSSNYLCVLGVLASCIPAFASAEKIDASDPTKIYSYAGPGYKTTKYSNGDTLSEIRGQGNLALGAQDMVMFELGYGNYSGTVAASEKENGFTNSRVRWFHLFKMDSSVVSGYRGWATQIDVQIEGEVKGTKGSNSVAMGALPAFGINEAWSFYLPVNYVSSWNSDFDKHTGHGISVAPMAAWAPEKGPWPGFFMQFWPNYTRYLAGDLEGEGAANLDITVGWSPADTVVVTLLMQQNFDKDLNFYTPSKSTSGANDYNLFLSASWYF